MWSAGVPAGNISRPAKYKTDIAGDRIACGLPSIAARSAQQPARTPALQERAARRSAFDCLPPISTASCLLGMASMRLGGRALAYEPVKRVIVVVGANKLLRREYRAPWKRPM